MTVAAAVRFPGVRCNYRYGSVAMGVVDAPVNDGDGGIVLDRRVYPNRGIPGGGLSPSF